MRLFLEALLAAGLIAIAWTTPYRERVAAAVPALVRSTSVPTPTSVSAATPVRVAEEQVNASAPMTEPAAMQVSAAAVSPTPSGSWMWDPKRPASLDRPGQSATPTVFTGHIYYADENGKKYWLDPQGKRHYDR